MNQTHTPGKGSPSIFEEDAFAAALCREYHPTLWGVGYDGTLARNRPCVACKTHAARLIIWGTVWGWTCQSCAADNFAPPGWICVTPPVVTEDPAP